MNFLSIFDENKQSNLVLVLVLESHFAFCSYTYIQQNQQFNFTHDIMLQLNLVRKISLVSNSELFT